MARRGTICSTLFHADSGRGTDGLESNVLRWSKNRVKTLKSPHAPRTFNITKILFLRSPVKKKKHYFCTQHSLIDFIIDKEVTVRRDSYRRVRKIPKSYC